MDAHSHVLNAPLKQFLIQDYNFAYANKNFDIPDCILLSPFCGGICTPTPTDSKGVTKELVSQVSTSFRKIGCICVLDKTIIRTNLDPSLCI